MPSDRFSEACDQETQEKREVHACLNQQPSSVINYHTYKYTNKIVIHNSYENTVYNVINASRKVFDMPLR